MSLLLLLLLLLLLMMMLILLLSYSDSNSNVLATAITSNNNNNNNNNNNKKSQNQNDNNDGIIRNIVEIDSSLIDIKWGDVDGTIVFVLSSFGRLYRSTDEGATWEDQLKYMPMSTVGTPYGIRQIIPLNNNNNNNNNNNDNDNNPDPQKAKFFFLGRQLTNWKTIDHGRSYVAIQSDSKTNFISVQFHPRHSDWGLALKWSDPICQQTSQDPLCHKQLYFTKDFGDNWQLLTTYVSDYGWGNAGDFHIPIERIYYISQSKKEGAQINTWSKLYSLYYTDNFSEKKQIEAVAYGNAFSVLNDYFFVAAVNEKTGWYRLFSSKAGGEFIESHLPAGLPEEGYTILDTDLGAVFLSANHGFTSSRWGNLYVSDALGSQYALSLQYNSRTTNGLVDFEKMQGLEGIYVANIVSDPNIASSPLQSRITFNNGGSWQPLQPPSRDSQGKPIQCVNDGGINGDNSNNNNNCNLHIHGITSNIVYHNNQFTTFYSVASAIGLMLATGNVGPHLLNSPASTNTYMSRDAGLTWFEVRKGPYIYEYGDHGALLVMAPLLTKTNSIIYSWNQGNSWVTYNITDSSSTTFDIDNVITEPSAKSQKFIVYGTTSTGQGVLVHLDFTGLHEQQCEGFETAGSSDSDYEFWSPSHNVYNEDDNNNLHCLLGHEIQYIRRKRDRQCFNDKTFETMKFVNNCTCVASDFECDSGYSVDVTKDELTCILVDASSVVKVPPTPCPKGSKYHVPNGYRLVAGDTCKGGAADAQYRPIEKKCSSSSSSSTTTSSILLYSFLTLIFVGLIFGCIVLYRTNPAFSNCCGSILSNLNIFSKGNNNFHGGRYYQLNTTRPDTIADDDEFALSADDDDDGPEELDPDKITITTIKK